MKKFIASLLALSLVFSSVMPTFASDVLTYNRVKLNNNYADLLYIDMNEGRTVDVAMGQSKLHTDVDVSTLINEPTKDNNSTVVAAINGGFFNAYYNTPISYPSSYPQVYSSIVRDGRLINGGGEGNYFGITWDGTPYIDRASFKAEIYTEDSTISLWSVGNYSTNSRAISLLTEEFPYTVSVGEGALVYTIKDDKFVAVSEPGNYSVPKGSSLLIYNKDAVIEGDKNKTLPKINKKAVIKYSGASVNSTQDTAWNNMKTAVTGGRMLLKNSVNVTADKTYNSAFDSDPKQSITSVAQRSFIGITKDKKLLLGTANGSFYDIAEYLKTIGVVDALSLDGGASSMLYDGGRGYLTKAGRKLATALVVVDEKNVEKPTVVNVPTPSIDVNTPSPWAVATIDSASKVGLIPDWLKFEYRKDITRREFCVLIVKLIEAKSGMTIDAFRGERGYTYAEAFLDTDDYYIRECASLGIVNGSDGYFRPNDSISREEAATILQRTATTLSIQSVNNGVMFNDMDKISRWAMDSVIFVAAVEIMNGTGENFNPKGMFTREQAFITMYNLFSIK